MKKMLGNNLGLKILALVFSALLWVLVVNAEEPITKKVYTGVEVSITHGEVVTNKANTYRVVNDTKTISVTLKGKRSVLEKIKAQDIVAVADMKNLMISSLVPITVTVPGYSIVEATPNPNNLEVIIDASSKKAFPITPATSGTLRDGYVLGEIKANPETVTISGPETVVNSISKVVAEVDVSGLSKDSELTAELILYDANDVIIDPTLLSMNLGEEGVTVDVKLLNTKTVDLNFDTSLIETAEGYNFAGLTVEPETVQISGNSEDLKNVTSIDIPAEALAMSGLSEKVETAIDISPYLPENIKLVDENSKKVAVKIKVEMLGTKTIEFPAGSIYLMNVADGFRVVYDTVDDLEIKIRGPQEILDTMNFDEDMNQKSVSANLLNYKVEGDYTVPLLIKLPEGCSLVSEVSVQITLEKQ